MCGGSVEDTRERVEGWCNEPGRVCVLVFLFWFVCDLTHTHTHTPSHVQFSFLSFFLSLSLSSSYLDMDPPRSLNSCTPLSFFYVGKCFSFGSKTNTNRKIKK